MRKITLMGIAALSLAFTACDTSGDNISTDIVQNHNTASAEPVEVALASMEFEDQLYDFGEITQGEKVQFTFTFTNTGENDLVIASANGSCGCTVPEWPKEPVRPGEKGEINVVFNSDGKEGKMHKKVYISANTQPSENVVALTGTVIAPQSGEN
ncbi:DUF1573 domain-containing protein [bacterium SCSIO 12741]|nr:DUF1573 domain-containing protein [bacterium SCSIO 12741]